MKIVQWQAWPQQHIRIGTNKHTKTAEEANKGSGVDPGGGEVLSPVGK